LDRKGRESKNAGSVRREPLHGRSADVSISVCSIGVDAERRTEDKKSDVRTTTTEAENQVARTRGEPKGAGEYSNWRLVVADGAGNAAQKVGSSEL
jgi:hypothetical protein